MNASVADAYARFLSFLTAGRGVRWQVTPDTVLRIDPRCRWIRHRDYEAPVVEYLRNRVRPGDCCIDIGAHVGFYVLQMALWAGPRGRVIGFEPNPTARQVLLNNVRLNRLPARVRIEAAALGSCAGTAPLFHSSGTSGLSRLGAPNPDVPHESDHVDVPVTTLDEYCAANGVTPDWILIDTEGVELDVLRGAVRTIGASRAPVVVEMHAPLWDNPETGAAIRSLSESCGRSLIPLTGQRDPLREYGCVAIEPVQSSIPDPRSGIPNRRS
jgi:FkbM family methyltransferase